MSRTGFQSDVIEKDRDNLTNLTRLDACSG